MANYVIILAAGRGNRLKNKIPKCFVCLKNIPIYSYSLKTFLQIKKIKKIVLVVPKQYRNKIMQNKKVIVTVGGETRNESFENGLVVLFKYLKLNDKIIVHDAARPYITKQDILKVIDSKLLFATLCYKGLKNNVDLHLKCFNVQTPQFFIFWTYLFCFKCNPIGKDLFTYLNFNYTNENFIKSFTKQKNKKITYKKDLSINS